MGEYIDRYCHRKNRPGKNGPAGPILNENLVRENHFWMTKVAKFLTGNRNSLRYIIAHMMG